MIHTTPKQINQHQNQKGTSVLIFPLGRIILINYHLKEITLQDLIDPTLYIYFIKILDHNPKKKITPPSKDY